MCGTGRRVVADGRDQPVRCRSRTGVRSAKQTPPRELFECTSSRALSHVRALGVGANRPPPQQPLDASLPCCRDDGERAELSPCAGVIPAESRRCSAARMLGTRDATRSVRGSWPENESHGRRLRALTALHGRIYPAGVARWLAVRSVETTGTVAYTRSMPTAVSGRSVGRRITDSKPGRLIPAAQRL